MKTTSGRFVLAFAPVAAALLLLIGCRGSQGPAGRDGVSFDTTPPVISILEPSYGDTLLDTMRVVVHTEDNVGIDEVTFFLDGSDQVDDSTWSYRRQEPYVWTYNFFTQGISPGWHSLMVRAYDTERNHTDTPTLFVYLQTLPTLGHAVLTTAPYDSLVLRPAPTRDPFDSTRTLDTLLFARFSPERNCRLDSVRIWLDSIPDVAMNYDRPLRIGVTHSNGVFPTDTIATMLLPVDGLGTTGWHSVALPRMVTFNRNDRFHVSVSVEEPSDSTTIALGEALVPLYDFATENRSGYYSLGDSPQGWKTLQEDVELSRFVPEFMIEAHVYYLQ